MDLNLNDDGPILPDPILGDLPADRKLELNAALDKAIARMESTNLEKLREQEKRLKDEHDKQLELAQRESTSAIIAAHLDGIPAEGALNVKAREQLHELRLSALTGTDEQKDDAWHLERAAEIVRLHQEERRKAGGDGAQHLPDMGLDGAQPNGDRRYSVDRLMLTLHDEVKKHGQRFDVEKFSGSPEAELTADLLKDEFTARKYAELTAAAGPGQRVIPFPAAAFLAAGDQLRLSETYAEAAAAATAAMSPDYRRDLLVMHFRPVDRLGFLGTMMETVSNDIMFSRVTGAPQATWAAEEAAASETQLTVATTRSSPKRLTTFDRVTWQRLASADRDFGVTPIVTSELMRGCRQAREAAVYTGAQSNGPTGLGGVTGVVAGVIGGAAGNTVPTYQDVLGMIVDVATEDIPADMLRWVTSWEAGQRLALALTFAASSSAFAVPLYRSSDMGVGLGTIANFPAALTSQVPKNLNSGAETANDEHAIIAGVWPYQLVIDYATMFITIDDISEAANGRTKLTVNSYHDLGTRVPPAFSYGEFKPF